MSVRITTSGDFKNITKWLDSVKNRSPKPTLQQIGHDGVSALKAATPMGDTGQTAYGWDFVVTETSTGAEVAFINTAHQHTAVNVAKIIQLGHATRTGGYVAPVNYIRPALRGVYKNFGDQVAKEMFK